MEDTKNLNIFDSSFLVSSDKHHDMTRDELVSEIIPKIEAILKERFPGNPQKQKIKIFKDRIAFAAPCCGDSAHSNSKKRGNIILDGEFRNMYKCHNCGCCMSMYNFFKRFGNGLSLDAIDYVISHKNNSLGISHDSSFQDSSINLLFDTEIIDEYAIDREYLKNKCHLEECSTPNNAYYYLTKRKQFDFTKFLYHKKHNLLFVLNLTPSGKIIGMQVRNLNKFYKGPKYKTYKLSKIYSLLMHEEKDIPGNIENMSMIFNILLIDYNKQITVLEGPMDSFLVSNSVALCGAGHNMPFDMKFRYLFDDDETGRKHSIEKLSEGYEVFMWERLKKDLNLPQREKWDINDVILWCNDNKIQLPNLSKYFSNDQFDLLDI